MKSSQPSKIIKFVSHFKSISLITTSAKLLALNFNSSPNFLQILELMLSLNKLTAMNRVTFKKIKSSLALLKSVQPPDLSNHGI